MQRKHISLTMTAVGAFLVLMTGVWMASAQPVSAQCGSSASSCKNCHEVQAEMPVNNDGTAWHQSHAFGDFCYICHAGNNQATDQAGAHTGLVAPLADIQASCMQCHPDDLEDRAQVYAAAMGVEIGSGGGSSDPVAASEPSAGETAPAEPAGSLPVSVVIDVDDPNLVDYVRRYDEIVLGKKPVNWGNVILIGLIVLLLASGGGFVVKNEKLVAVTFGDTRKVEGEYPGDIVAMLPSIAKLKPQARKSLSNLLGNPGKAEKVLGLIEALVTEKKTEQKA